MTLLEGKYWFDVSSTGTAAYVKVTLCYRRPDKKWYQKEFVEIDDSWHGKDNGTPKETARRMLETYFLRSERSAYVNAVLEEFGTGKHPLS